MTDKLTLYNLALGHLRENKIASLSENREPRRVLDDYWDANLAWCLERKLWNFAKRTVQVDASTTVVPGFGPKYAFRIPEDWIRTIIVSPEQTCRQPLLNYLEEAGYWYADLTPLYVSYTSNDPLYGLNLGAWPASMEDFVALRLAAQACGRITNSTELKTGKGGLDEQWHEAYKVCSANCSMNDPPAYLPPGTWQKSRRGFMTRIGGSGDNPSGSLLG
jgi:hypothetical protein